MARTRGRRRRPADDELLLLSIQYVKAVLGDYVSDVEFVTAVALMFKGLKKRTGTASPMIRLPAPPEERRTK